VKKFFLLCFILCIALLGCGDSGNTNGTLVLSELTATVRADGTYLVTGTATYTPGGGKQATGTEMSVSANLITAQYHNTVSMQTSGNVDISYSAPQPSSPGVATVDVSVGDLKQHKEVAVAALIQP